MLEERTLRAVSELSLPASVGVTCSSPGDAVLRVLGVSIFQLLWSKPIPGDQGRPRGIRLPSIFVQCLAPSSLTSAAVSPRLDRDFYYSYLEQVMSKSSQSESRTYCIVNMTENFCQYNLLRSSVRKNSNWPIMPSKCIQI